MTNPIATVESHLPSLVDGSTLPYSETFLFCFVLALALIPLILAFVVGGKVQAYFSSVRT